MTEQSTKTSSSLQTKEVPYVRPDTSEFLAWNNSQPESKTGGDMEPSAMRDWYARRAVICDSPVGELAEIKDLVFRGPGGEIGARLFDVRSTREPGPAIVFFHGGGYVFGDLDTHAGFCAEMSRVTDLPVISIDYRRAPEAKWPAAPDDCEAGARWVAESPPELGRSVTSLVICGDSAGGNITIVVSMDLRDRPAKVPVIVQAPIYPSWEIGTDYPSFHQFSEGYLLTLQGMLWMVKHYAADPTSHRALPKLGSLTGLPPAVIQTASLDPLRDQGRSYAAALINQGTPVVYREAIGNIHGFINLRKAIPSSHQDVASFLAAFKTAIIDAEGRRVRAISTE